MNKKLIAIAHKNNKKGNPFVAINSEGYMQLFTEDGHKISANVFLRIQDGIDGINTAIGKFYVNIVGSVEEMKREIEKYHTENDPE